MSVNNVKCLFKKELLDVLRDKKTVIMMVVVPVIIYPLLMIVSLQLMSKITTDMSKHIYKIAIYDEENGKNIGSLNSRFDDYDFEDYSLAVVDNVRNPEDALANEDIDAYIKISVKDNKEVFEVCYLSTVTNSNYAANRVSDFLTDYASDLTKDKLESLGLDPDVILKPIKVSYADASTNEETAGSILSSIIPFMLVVSLLMGTMYPAIDTTAGERERGTLETLLTLPVTNTEIIVSKFLVVAAIGITSAILNIVSLSGVGVYMYNMTNTYMGMKGGIDVGKFIPAIIVGILCVFAFAVFISAITMCVTAFAKTYKEANNYITPLSLVVMFASFVAFIPNIKLTDKAALLPVANICLLVRDMLAFKFSANVIMLVLISNVLYGIIAIWFLGKIYNSEAILFGESAAGVQIFERRKNLKRGGVPELGDMILVLAFTMVMMIYVGGAIQLKFGYFGMLGTQVFILMIPILAAAYTKKDMLKTFKIKKCKASYFFAAACMMFGTMLIGMVITYFLGLISSEGMGKTAELQYSLLSDNFAATLFVVAVVPAVCEELMFRGYIFSALQNKLKPQYAMLITACFFGIYHMSLIRFIVTAILGYVTCYVVYKSGSIFTGMLMHFINNGLSCVVMCFPEQVKKICPVLTQADYSISDVLFLIVIGMMLIYVGSIIINSNNKEKAVN